MSRGRTIRLAGRPNSPTSHAADLRAGDGAGGFGEVEAWRRGEEPADRTRRRAGRNEVRRTELT